MNFREEIMSAELTKYHLEGFPFDAVLHKFTDIDQGDPHDHPWPFRSIILKGGYTERVFDKYGNYTYIHREVGDSFRIESEHIHQIVNLPDGECWTLILPEPKEKDSGFWKFEEDGVYFRYWYETEFKKIS